MSFFFSSTEFGGPGAWQPMKRNEIVAGNVKDDGIQRIEQNGPFKITGEHTIMQSLDELLHSFVDQQRMKVPGKIYTPCYYLHDQ